MGFAPTLPAELWLMILDLAIEDGIIPVEHCNPTSFPDIDAYLQSPRDYPLADDTYRQLRLVCRNFHALLGTSPHFFMKSPGISIPTTARALYITDSLNYKGCFEQLLTEPSISQRIIKLDVSCGFWGGESRATSLFRTLCENSGSLPNLRCLALRLLFRPLRHLGNSFWIRLNAAFPLLTCLTISLDIPTAGILMDVHTSGTITFRNIQILSLSRQMDLDFELHLPSLRHVALGRFSQRSGVTLARSPLLESLLLHRIDHHARIDLRSLPRLRLLGVQIWDATLIHPIDAIHPLEHLWIYMHPMHRLKDLVDSVTQIPGQLPGISRITIDFSTRVDGVQLKNMLQDRNLRSSGLVLQSNLGDDSRIVLERTWKYGPPRFFAKPGSGEKRGILEGIWRKIRRESHVSSGNPN